jgi:nucleoid-associated protein YgaU
LDDCGREISDAVTGQGDVSNQPCVDAAPNTTSDTAAVVTSDVVITDQNNADQNNADQNKTGQNPDQETEINDIADNDGSEQPAVPALAAPTVDVVRVSPDGTAVVAGRSAPGSTVEILVDDAVVAEVTAGQSDGSFASFLTIELTNKMQVLTLQARLGDQVALMADQIYLAPAAVTADPSIAQLDDGATSDVAANSNADTIGGATDGTIGDATDGAIGGGEGAAQQTQTQQPQTAVDVAELSQSGAEDDIQVTAQSGSAPDAAQTANAPQTDLTDAGSDQTASGETADAQSTDAMPDTATIPAATHEPDPETAMTAPAQVAVLRAGEKGLEVLQGGSDPQTTQALLLDVIGYSDDGAVQLAGRGGAGHLVRFYLDNQALTDAIVAADGRWAANFVGIEAGIYTLRVDEIAANGDVVNRLETPFKREAPEALQPPQPTGAEDTTTAVVTAPVRAITVQAGDTLWAISQNRYGDGVLYVKVLEANKAAIRDPDLIYPGQVFSLPE